MPFPLSLEACPHAWNDSSMICPFPNSPVHRDECAYCCRSCSEGDGIYVCMACHAGLCFEHLAKHVSLHTEHVMFTIVRKLPAKETNDVRDVNFLGVVAPEEYETAVCCACCQVQFAQVPDMAVETCSSIVNAPVPGAQESAAQGALGRQQKYQCPHLVSLEQLASPFALHPPTSDDLCNFQGCECHVNNWMCVTCGAIGCPRPVSGGSGHALQHYELTGHPASVKLGTITPQGADFYCYACDEDVDDVHFAAHMAHFGIDVSTAKKTAKTMGELEYDYTLQFDFNQITEADASLTPSYGPGHTGIRNIGNSCYLASVVQCLMSLGPFQGSFFPNGSAPHQAQCKENPYVCRHCQTERLSAGLLSGEFSKEGQQLTNGVCPRLFKNVYARRHPDFSTGAQQDAQEYLLYLLEEMRQHVPLNSGAAQQPTHPADIMEMVMEERIQCKKCARVRYAYERSRCLTLPIPIDPEVAASAMSAADKDQMPKSELDALRPRCALEDCLQALFSETRVECRCEACLEPTEYITNTRVTSFPDVLPVYIRRTYFDAATCSTKKMDVYVNVPQELVLEEYRGTGLQISERPMSEVSMPASASTCAEGSSVRNPQVTPSPLDEESVMSLVSMGFDKKTSIHALRKANGDVERAVECIINLLASGGGMPDEAELEDEEKQSTVKQSCKTTDGSIPKSATDGYASYELKAMISHMGASARTGHYICHIKDDATGKWLLFNDEKVGESKNPPFSLAALYFFQRKG